MKKLFLSFAVIAGLSMISCGNKAETEATDATENTEEVAEEAAEEVVVADSAAVDTVAVVEEVVAE